jgi:hypothetical protein
VTFLRLRAEQTARNPQKEREKKVEKKAGKEWGKRTHASQSLKLPIHLRLSILTTTNIASK